MNGKKIILGIETSCDETALAVVGDGCRVLSNIVSSQVRKHAQFGGVVPELAAREHLLSINSVAESALKGAGLGMRDVSSVAVTCGPGLIPALLVGLNFAKGLAFANSLPLIGVNHFLAHICGAFLDDRTSEIDEPESYPLLALVVSGGHSALLLVQDDSTAKMIGATLDDAAGESLDKAAKLLGLGYPGGPAIEKAARNGNPGKFAFPRPMTGASGKALDQSNRFNFSFSGVKTSLYYHCKKYAHSLEDLQFICDSAASYQEAVFDVLVRKTIDAVNCFSVKTLAVCGGVACNSLLRKKISDALPGHVRIRIARPEYCADNAAMVAALAFRMPQATPPPYCELDAFSRLPPFIRAPFGAGSIPGGKER